ncbi:hypothetical protein C8Q76DRAFT_851766 [Earliella scabrosa]|nr:hypothetical protein C8Q76DRAFT_851766 [Earliella scabrosa]
MRSKRTARTCSPADSENLDQESSQISVMYEPVPRMQNSFTARNADVVTECRESQTAIVRTSEYYGSSAADLSDSVGGNQGEDPGKAAYEPPPAYHQAGILDLPSADASLVLSSLFPTARAPERLAALLAAPESVVLDEPPLLTGEQSRRVLRAAAFDACELIMKRARALNVGEHVGWDWDVGLQ